MSHAVLKATKHKRVRQEVRDTLILPIKVLENSMVKNEHSAGKIGEILENWMSNLVYTLIIGKVKTKIF